MDPSEAYPEEEGKEALMSKSNRLPMSPEELRERHEFKKRLKEANLKWEQEYTEEQLNELADNRLRNVDPQ